MKTVNPLKINFLITPKTVLGLGGGDRESCVQIVGSDRPNQE